VKCPSCGHGKSKVVDSRSGGEEYNARWRRRECEECGGRFSTVEMVLDPKDNRARSAFVARLAHWSQRFEKAESILHGLRVEFGKLKSQHDTLFSDEMFDNSGAPLPKTMGRPKGSRGGRSVATKGESSGGPGDESSHR